MVLSTKISRVTYGFVSKYYNSRPNMFNPILFGTTKPMCMVLEQLDMLVSDMHNNILHTLESVLEMHDMETEKIVSDVEAHLIQTKKEVVDSSFEGLYAVDPSMACSLKSPRWHVDTVFTQRADGGFDPWADNFVRIADKVNMYMENINE